MRPRHLAIPNIEARNAVQNCAARLPEKQRLDPLHLSGGLGLNDADDPVDFRIIMPAKRLPLTILLKEALDLRHDVPLFSGFDQGPACRFDICALQSDLVLKFGLDPPARQS